MSASASASQPLPGARLSISRRGFRNPNKREWLTHSLLFLATLVSTTFAGIMLAAPEPQVNEPILSDLLSYVLYVPSYYVRIVVGLLLLAASQPELIINGLTFSLALLTILTAHEMGHYLACRHYGVNATLPFFLPAPPLFLAGTFGAFIKMKSTIPSRQALFDIGLAGPLAGFVALLPFAAAGILRLQNASLQTGDAQIIFNDPLLFQLMAKFAGIQLIDAAPNPFYMAAWIGLLVTSLNLMPVGQLDGGHGTFAVFGQRLHKIIGKVAFAIMAVMAVMGFVWYGSPSGFLYTLLLAVMLRVRHPAPENMAPLGTARAAIGIITIIVFGLSFVPFPITLS